MYYARGPTDDCAPCGDTCTSDEVSATCLLDSLTVYVARERAALESALGVAIDSSILLSGEDFSSTTAGLAWMNGLCVDTWSGSIVEDSGSVAVTAAVMAHELGHLLGMGHDEGGPNIMQAVMTSGDPHDTGMQFRDLAREEADGYFTSKYGSSNFWPECLNENVETSWDTPVCGDGIVDIGEQCDPGIFVDDACCTSDCLLEAGCGCANSDACCTDGALTAPGVVCRPAQHDECDEEEVCTGKMSDCPVDLYKSPGTDCTEKIFPDDSDAKSNEDGKCYRGECISQAGSCIDPNTGGAIYDGSTPHTSYCDGASDCSITYCSESSLLGGCIGYNEPARDGTECGSGKQCRTSAIDIWTSRRAGRARRASTQQDLKDYHWSFGDDGCREPVCVDEEGTEADPTCTVCCEGAAPANTRLVHRGADGLAAAVGVARADGGAVRAAHAGADVDVRAHGPEGRRLRRDRRARPRPGAQVVHRRPRRHHGRPRRARVAVHVRREALPPEAPAPEARQARRPRPSPGAACPPGPPVAAAPELVAPGRRHVREDVLRQPRDGGDELGETRRTGLIATPSNTICRVWSCGSESVLAPGADAIAATPASLKVTQIRNRLGRD